MNSITRTLTAMIGVSVLVFLTACTSTGATATPVTPLDGGLPTLGPATPTPTLAPATATPTATPLVVDPVPTPDATPIATPDPGDDDLVLARGKELFDTAAGGLGCAYCHKADATGDPVLGSPDIRGVTANQIFDALETRAQMTFITMTEQEVDAVAAYLATFATQ